MKLGFLTVGPSPLTLDEMLQSGAENHFETIEIARSVTPHDVLSFFRNTQLQYHIKLRAGSLDR